MKTIWTKGLDLDAEKEMRADFKSSLYTRKRLITLATEKLDLSTKDSRNKDNYENPNWPYLQADCRGYERALQEIISILS